MRQGLFSRKSLLVVDILMMFELIVVLIFTKVNAAAIWVSPHCIIGVIWMATMFIHVMQHWRIIKLFIRSKIIVRNKISTITTVTFIIMIVSILLFTGEINTFSRGLHHIIGRLFLLMVVLHIINITRRLISRKKNHI